MNIQFLFLLITLAPIHTWAESPAQTVVSEKRILIDQIDEALGGDRADDLRTTSTLRLKYTDEDHRGLRTPESALHMNFNLKLGKLQDWQNETKAWFETRWQHWKAEHTPRPYSSELHKTEPEQSKDAKEKRAKSKNPDDWQFTFQKHISFTKKADIWLHGRLRRDFEFEHVLHTLATELGWGARNHWEYNNYLVSHIQLARYWALQFNNSVFWHISEDEVSSNHGPGVTYLINERQVISLSGSVAMENHNHSYRAESYSLNLNYRLAAWRNWLFLGVSPYIDYPRAIGFRDDPGISVSAEAVF